MEIFKNPWKDKLMFLVQESEKSIQISSPFVKENICKEILLNKKNNVSFELITSFNLSNAYNGALDLQGLELILDNRGIVKNYSRLHLKIYIFDSKKAVVTSGNLTNGGLVTNYEYGIFLDDSNIVSKIQDDFDIISKNSITGLVTKEHIAKANSILSRIPSKVKLGFPSIEIHDADINSYVIENMDMAVESTLNGWKLSVFKIISTFPKQEFMLQDVYKFEEELQAMYPGNKNVKAKIRQQVQFLRDLGMVEFVSNDGKYRKLWK